VRFKNSGWVCWKKSKSLVTYHRKFSKFCKYTPYRKMAARQLVSSVVTVRRWREGQGGSVCLHPQRKWKHDSASSINTPVPKECMNLSWSHWLCGCKEAEPMIWIISEKPLVWAGIGHFKCKWTYLENSRLYTAYKGENPLISCCLPTLGKHNEASVHL